jgi:hypothetical protein
LRWEFPSEAKARQTTASSSRSIYRFRMPPGLPGNRKGSLFDEARIDVIEGADMTRELDRLRRVYGMKGRGEDIGSFEVFGNAPRSPSLGPSEVVLVPADDASYFIHCRATSTDGSRRLLRTCEVALQLRPLAQVRYYIDADDVFRVGEINERMRSIVGAWIVTPTENTSHGNAR